MRHPAHDPKAPEEPRNQFGVASLVLGVAGLLTCWLLIGLFLGIAAVITGDIGRGRVKRGEAKNPRTAMVGIVLGALAIVAGIVAVGYYAQQDDDQPDRTHGCTVNGTSQRC